MNSHSGYVFGYARVSAADQNLARQIEAIGDVKKMYTDKASGKSTARPELLEMIDRAWEGDTVRVKSVDRLARSTTDLLDIVQKLRNKGVAIEFIDTPAMDTDSAQGEFMLTILAAVAQLERAMIRERQAEGIAIAKTRGVYARTPKLTPEQIAQARASVALEVPKAVVARKLGVSRATLYNALAGRGRYAEPAT
jgi:DNA invertase Pin-like site-specific DNA recombinase